RPGVGRVRIRRTGRAEHDPAAWRPAKLRMIDPVAVTVDDNLLEAKRVDEEPDEGPGVPGSQRRPHLRRGCLVCHATEPFSIARGSAWTFRNSSASHRRGGQPASDRKSLARWAGRSTRTRPPGWRALAAPGLAFASAAAAGP